MTEQAVTDDPAKTDAPNEGTEAKPGAPGAQDDATDWDALIGESKPTTESKPEPKAGEVVSREEFDALKDDLAKKSVKEAIEGAVGTIKGNFDDLKDVPDRMVRSYLYGLAEDKPELLLAFGNRQQDPATWNKAMKLIGKEITADLAERPDAHLTEDAQAAADAVRGVSNQAPAEEKPDPAKYSAMSDAEYDEQERKDLAAAGGK